MDGIRYFVIECGTGRTWEFDNEMIENAERHIRKWVENRSEECGKIDIISRDRKSVRVVKPMDERISFENRRVRVLRDQ